MAPEILFIMLAVTATAVAIAARRLQIPYTVALVAAGLVLGAFHVLTPPHLTKEILFAFLLPALLFEAAFHLDLSDFSQGRAPILALAVPGVVASIAIIAVLLAPVVQVLGLAEGFTWRHALVFGALIAATDPVAVVGLFKHLGVPKRLSVLIEGESLLNDGTSIVLFTLVLGFATGADVSWSGLGMQFARVVGLGAAVGAVVGLLVSLVIQRIDDPMIEITLTTLAAYGAFAAAEQLHDSGVIATVVAGMFCGNYAARTGMTPSTRIAVETFWEYAAFGLNSVIFLLLGFSVRLSSLLASWKAILAAYFAVTVGRGLVVAAVSWLLKKSRNRIPPSWALVLTWGGLRGGLSMVLALALPPAFPHRDLLVTMTFGIVVLSILLNGLTLAPLLRLLGIARGGEERDRYEVARGALRASQAALAEIRLMTRRRFTHPGVLASLREEYERRAEGEVAEVRKLGEDRDRIDEERRGARRRLLLVERQSVLDAYHGGELGVRAYERLLADIDARLAMEEQGRREAPEPAEEAQRRSGGAGTRTE
jgi:CPA1 family monovalent cation:H+ antiporter